MFLLLLTRSDEIIIDLFLISDVKKLLIISSFVVEELAKKTFLISIRIIYNGRVFGQYIWHRKG